MLLRAIELLLGILLSVVGICFVIFLMFHYSEKADSEFEIRMLKDINEVGRKLKETELDDKTVRTIKYALEDIQRNVQYYVNAKSLWQTFPIVLLIPMYVIFFESVRRITQKKVMP